MLFKKSWGLNNLQYKFAIRLFLTLPFLSLLTSCTTTFIPGLDRILFSNSSAKVGPLVVVDEQYPANNDKGVTASTENESIAKPVTDSPKIISETESSQQLGKDTAPEPTIQATGSRTVPTSKAIDSQPPPTKVKPEKADELGLPGKASPEVAIEKEHMEIAVEYGAVTGTVVLIGNDKQPLPATGTMITLTPKTMINEALNRPPQVHIIDMEDKEYQPRYSTIHAGDQVVFVNKDNIRHNVFSLSENNSFDLGTYGAGLKRAVTLKEPGVVKIYCNIHPEMATFVAVGNQGLSVRADDQGRYQIGEILPGNYEVTIWNIRGETKRVVQVKANKTIELIDRIDTTAFRVEPHKNKFGGNYSKNSTLFEDEFY